MPTWPLLAAIVLAAPPTADLSDLCRGRADDATIELSRDAFAFSGYDVRRGLVAVNLSAALPRAGAQPVPVVLPEGPLLIAIRPRTMALAIEGMRAGRLTLDLTVKKVATATGPLDVVDCQTVRPIRLSLRYAHAVLATRDLTRPLRLARRVHARVDVRPPQRAAGTPSFPEAALLHQAQLAGEACLRDALQGASGVRGAIHLELQTSAVGAPERPLVRVDAVAYDPLTHCLVRTVHADPALWADLPAGAKIFLPFYFRGGPAAPPSGDRNWLLSGSKAP